MREPKGHYADDEGEECLGCGEEWPCSKWRRWTSSSSYRIAELERRMAAVERQANHGQRPVDA